MFRTSLLVLAVLISGPLACSAADAPATSAAPAVSVLDPQASQLRTDFNDARDSVRLVFVIDPICPVCLRGLADIDKALLADTRDPRLRTFVVHTSVIGATADDVPTAAALLSSPDVRHYWDPTGNLGRAFTNALRLERDGEPVYAWDVWMVYDSGAIWGVTAPPTPELLMHQLPSLRGQPGLPFLDADEFAARVRALLADGTAVGPDE